MKWRFYRGRLKAPQKGQRHPRARPGEFTFLRDQYSSRGEPVPVPGPVVGATRRRASDLERPGSTCAIEVEGLKRRPTVGGGLSLEFRSRRKAGVAETSQKPSR